MSREIEQPLFSDDSMSDAHDHLIILLRRAVGLIDDTQGALKADTIEICDRIQSPTYRIAVFGPFNYGKSTLLNALLGEKTLPMDLVPTTGTAITVKYGSEPCTRIIHTDGSVHTEVGTSTLKDYAVLDEQRQMRTDIAAVEVYCPHPLLKLGIELVDLPGTDDQQAQNDLVQKQLLSVDLVIQLLDGRKLMTLTERSHLEDWLLSQGISNVIFVVNFLNMMDASDRQDVSHRLRFLAESFRTQLPDGVSNIYPVDALPALRARLKGDIAAATQTGLPALEAALQTIGTQCAKGRPPAQTLPRLKAIAEKIQQALQEQIDTFSTTAADENDMRKLALKQKAQSLIQSGFRQQVEKLRKWLAPKNLQAHYRLGLAEALASGRSAAWLLTYLEPAWRDRTTPLIDWVHQASDMFNRPCPPDLHMAFAATNSKAPGQSKTADVQDNGVDFTHQADIYLNRFSADALTALDTYEKASRQVISHELSMAAPSISQRREAQLNLLKTTVEELTDLIEETES